MLKNIWIGKDFLIVMHTLCSFIVLENISDQNLYQQELNIELHGSWSDQNVPTLRCCMQDVSVYKFI